MCVYVCDASITVSSFNYRATHECRVTSPGSGRASGLASSELVSLAAKGESFPWRFGAMPPVTMRPTPFLALLNTCGGTGR